MARSSQTMIFCSLAPEIRKGSLANAGTLLDVGQSEDNLMAVKPGEHETNWINVARFVLSRRARSRVLARKVIKRLRRENNRGSEENDAWLGAHSTTAEALANRYELSLWEGSAEFDKEFRNTHRPFLQRSRMILAAAEITDSSTGSPGICSRSTSSKLMSPRMELARLPARFNAKDWLRQTLQLRFALFSAARSITIRGRIGRASAKNQLGAGA